MNNYRETFGLRFSTLSRQWRRHLDKRLFDLGITDVTWAPLIHLDNLGDGINQKQLARSVGIEGPAQVRLLDNLEKRGEIVRKTSELDRRNKLVYLTATGAKKVKRIRAHLKQIEEHALAQITDAQLKNFYEVLDKLEVSIGE